MEFVPVEVPGGASAVSPGGETMTMPPAGNQAAAGAATPGDQDLLRWVGLGLVGLVLIGAVVYGATQKKLPPAPRSNGNLSADPRTRRLLVKLADLEDAFEAGQVDEESYTRQRSELYEAIKALPS
jgi:hypothetical protein